MLFLSVFFSLSLRLSDSLSLSLDLSIPQHSRCIDTALIYPHPKGKTYKFSLKSLGERYLGRKIQTKESGHDSIEDASCAMQLCRLKLLFGPTFGEHEFEGESICSILTRHNKYASLADRRAVLRRHAVGSANALACTSDEEVGESPASRPTFMTRCPSPSLVLSLPSQTDRLTHSCACAVVTARPSPPLPFPFLSFPSLPLPLVVD